MTQNTRKISVRFDLEALEFAKVGGLMPAIVQDEDTLQVLMLGYMDRAALEETLQSGEATFFSRSRGGRWRKGETSGDRLIVSRVETDCDRDTLLVLARPLGPTCHLKTPSCFGSEGAQGVGQLMELSRTIKARRDSASEQESYTARLFAKGQAKIAQKVGEEGLETALAGRCGDLDELHAEAGDLLYHLLVLLEARGTSLSAVLDTLKQRRS